MNWINQAVCAKDKNGHKWLSFNLSDIDYAKRGCESCNVKKQCLMETVEERSAGVRAGMSEFDRLMADWKEARDIDDNNWD